MVQQSENRPANQVLPEEIASLTAINSQPKSPETPDVQLEQPSAAPMAEFTWLRKVQRTLDSLCHTELFQISQLGICIYDLTDRQFIYSLNAAQRMRPASCQKLVTSISALNCLGGDYQFRTQLCLTGNIAGRVLKGDVFVVGGMDPLLSVQDLKAMAAALKNSGIDRIEGSLCADLTMKDDLPLGSGWCWDDDFGPLSALMVDGRDDFARLWPAALSSAGIRATRPTVVTKALPRNGVRNLTTISHSIDEVLVPLMKNSDNIMAECLFYQIAAKEGVKQAGLKQARAQIQRFLEQLGLDNISCQVADGSGLSLYNYLTPELLVNLLNYAYQTPSIIEHLLPSLPIAGVDGTLEKRMTDTSAQGNVKAKTGTVEGISSLSGYLRAANGHDVSFSIINQGIIRGSQGRDFQDKVCTLLTAP